MPVSVTGQIDELPPEARAEVAALAVRARRAQGPVMAAMNAVGGKLEGWAARLPSGARAVLDSGAERLLLTLYQGAAGARKHAPEAGDWGHKWAATLSGAVGGAAGLASAAIELPATVTVMFSAMQRIAAENGFDPDEDDIRLMCLDIFGSGAPGKADDGVNSTFLGSRLAVNGTTLHTLITRIAPAFSAMLGRQLAAKAVPVLGAVAGAGINYLFTDYYQDVARVRFGLMRLVRQHGQEPIHRAFRAEMARKISG